ncbi:class E sortase [Actinomycetospora sp. NBRC 106375]|uniref:sortase n=1 Tax=Actinomycetospora sp. NBRC 106375 TaxID=3032207 RepID=UPI002556BC3E|nr:class E sortase [Actinomycetospora sp. NBRC 106375]
MAAGSMLDRSGTTAETRVRSLVVDEIVRVPDADEVVDRGRHRFGGEEAKERARRRERTLSVVAGALVVLALLAAAVVLLDLRAAPARAVNKAQLALGAELTRTWAAPGPDPALARDESPLSELPGDVPASAAASLAVPGAAVAPVLQLSAPRLGRMWTVARGVSPAALAAGPGLYPGMAPIGTPGNTAIAGRRLPALFGDLPRLLPGDELAVRTRTTELTYRVLTSEVVLPTDLGILDSRPVDRRPQGTSTLTLTTPTTVADEDRRFVVYAELTGSRPR